MNVYPEELTTSRGGIWKRRPDLDAQGAAYEHMPGGTIGSATGRLIATIPISLAAQAKEWLVNHGFRMRTIHEGKTVVLSIEAEDTLRPLRMFREIASVPGLERVEPEILMAKSKKRP